MRGGPRRVVLSASNARAALVRDRREKLAGLAWPASGTQVEMADCASCGGRIFRAAGALLWAHEVAPYCEECPMKGSD